MLSWTQYEKLHDFMPYMPDSPAGLIGISACAHPPRWWFDPEVNRWHLRPHPPLRGKLRWVQSLEELTDELYAQKVWLSKATAFHPQAMNEFLALRSSRAALDSYLPRFSIHDAPDTKPALEDLQMVYKGS